MENQHEYGSDSQALQIFEHVLTLVINKKFNKKEKGF
jgi:hypothetical protein